MVAFFVRCDSKQSNNNANRKLEIDSVQQWIVKSKKQLTYDEKHKYLLKAYLLNKTFKNDSLKNKNLISITYESYVAKDTSFFKKINRELQILSNKIRDSNGIAEYHWNYATFYKDKEILDSAYYHYNKANVLYDALKNDHYSGKMLYNMAFIESRLKNYTSSEVFIFKAISKYKPLKKNFSLYRCYNLLGILYKGLEEYDKAIYYYNQALSYLDKVKNQPKGGILNNMGLVYQKQGNLKKAKIYFINALNNLGPKQQISKARIINNLAYSKFLSGDFTNLPQEFYKALAMRDSLNNKAGIISSQLSLAEYYAKFNDTLKAINYAKEAKALAKITNINTSALRAHKLLSKIDKQNAKTHLIGYISLKDSLEVEERKTRNKFTRLRFETDEYVEETKRLSQQKIWISTIGVTLTLILSLLYFIKQQRSKNKELQYEAEQQKYNQEIYELILKQQIVLEEGRLQERHRISEELHDGVLSKLFGTRMGLGFLNLEGDSSTLNKYESYVEELQSVEKEIRVISHELKNEILSSKFSYIKIIESLVQKQSKIVGYTYKLTSDDSISWEGIDEKIKMNLYRITQEALLNINKYAEASMVDLNFKMKGNTLELSIKDNGKGFNINKNRKGIGLSNMQARMKKLGGKASISSSINSGTNIVASIAIKL